ncbi:hypothetical protein AURDEDRAFT_111757 [Auricularia subglabra TFB-10046 SS5]|nr:hypothetical protein AURDEDRAFT_111757 [Auricularia subglabra TFB-10046 SS5]
MWLTLPRVSFARERLTDVFLLLAVLLVDADNDALYRGHGPLYSMEYHHVRDYILRRPGALMGKLVMAPFFAYTALAFSATRFRLVFEYAAYGALLAAARILRLLAHLAAVLVRTVDWVALLAGWLVLYHLQGADGALALLMLAAGVLALSPHLADCAEGGTAQLERRIALSRAVLDASPLFRDVRCPRAVISSSYNAVFRPGRCESYTYRVRVLLLTRMK